MAQRRGSPSPKSRPVRQPIRGVAVPGPHEKIDIMTAEGVQSFTIGELEHIREQRIEKEKTLKELEEKPW